MSVHARLSYQASPDHVAVSDGGVASSVSITFTAANASAAPVQVAQIVLVLPQGDRPGDLMAPHTLLAVGSVHSSDGTSWSIVANGNQATLVPVNGSGFATLAPGAKLYFTLSDLQVTTAGANEVAKVAVHELDQDGSLGTRAIDIAKIAAGFSVANFQASQYNVAAGSPVTVTWEVLGALSCEVDASVVGVAMPAAAAGGPGRSCGIGTANPNCDGRIGSGSQLEGSNTCNVQGPTLFTLTARGKSGEGDATLTSQLLVTVNAPALDFTGYPPTTMLGQSVDMKWVSADAAKLQLYIAPAQGQASVEDKTGTPMGSQAEVPLVDTTYYLYAFTHADDPDPARQLQFPVIVYPPAWTQTPVVSNPPTPLYPGDELTLDWSVQNVASCRLDCSVAGFTPLEGLPLSGPLRVAVPDPGVPQADVVFTLAAVMFGTQGDFSPQAVPVTVTNTPNISAGLAANPAIAAPGAAFELTWTADHADSGTLTDDLPGSTWSQAVLPASGSQAMTMPAVVLPTPVAYTLTLDRGAGQYTSATACTVQCAGQVTRLSCNGKVDSDYLAGLYRSFPGKRITQVGLAGDAIYGVTAIHVWYSDNPAADYVISPAEGSPEPPSSTLVLGETEYVTSVTCCFGPVPGGNAGPSGLSCLTLQTNEGGTITAGVTGYNQPSTQVDAPFGQQVIAFSWQLAAIDEGSDESPALDDFGLICCTQDYGA